MPHYFSTRYYRHSALSRFQRINKIKNYTSANKDQYYAEFFGLTSNYLSDERKIKELVKYTDLSIRDTEEFYDHFGKAIINFFENKTSKYLCLTAKYVGLMEFCSSFLRQPYKEALIDIILARHNTFCFYLKKRLAKNAIDFVRCNDEKRIINIIKIFKYSISVYDFRNLMLKIPDGIFNADVKKALAGVNKFESIRYTKEEIECDQDKRRNLIRSIIKRPTIAKDLDFRIHVTMEDIKSLPPMTRFRFFKLACDFLFNIIILPPTISKEEVRNLLFTACIHKNNECSEWLRLHTESFP